MAAPVVAPKEALPLSDVIARLLAPEADTATHDFRGQRVLVRADLNVPLSREGRVTDRERIDAALPTLRQLADGGAHVVVASHLGRPQPGEEPEAAMRARDSLRPVAALLAEALGEERFIGIADDCAGPSAAALVARLRDGQARSLTRAPGTENERPRRLLLLLPTNARAPGRHFPPGRQLCAHAARACAWLAPSRPRAPQVCLLENTRFEPGDVANDASLAASLASLCDAFVLDGFGVCHRAQASVSGVARALPPSRRFPGPLVRRELQFLGAALDAPVRPFGVVLGGMKARAARHTRHTRVARAACAHAYVRTRSAQRRVRASR
jgi:phosphoglycerate kinase